MPLPAFRFVVLYDDWKTRDERCTAIAFVERKRAFVRACYPLGERKTESAATRTAADKTFKQPLAQFRNDAFTVIAHAQHGAAAVNACCDRDARFGMTDRILEEVA